MPEVRRFTGYYVPDAPSDRAGWYVQVVGYEYNPYEEFVSTYPLMFLVRFLDGTEMLVFPEEVSK